MKPIFAISFAAIYGFLLRVAYGFLGDFMGIMSTSFLIIGPVIIGFFTVFFTTRKKSINNSSAFFRPWLTCLIILVVTIAINIEGVICWVMIFPLFALLAGIGGVIANNIRRKKEEIEDIENYDEWTKPDKLTVSLIMLMPLIFGMLEGDRTQNRKDMEITQAVIIKADPQKIWRALANINVISKNEKQFSFSGLLGFPRHLNTTLDTMAMGGKRKAVYEKGLYFDETISQYEEGKLLILDIKTDPKNIPPTVMDEHILIGGKHVDILKDTYRLEALPDGSCRLSLCSNFFISTSFNWYAGIWADYLMKDILMEELELVKVRAEKIAQ